MKKGESPRVDLKGRVMIVPLGDSEIERNARQHEMGHAAWTDHTLMQQMVEQYGVHQMLVQGVEDARINTNLGNMGLPQDAEVFDDESLDNIAYIPPQDQMALLFGTIATGDEQNVREVIRRSDYPEIEAIVDGVLTEAGLQRGDGLFNTDEVTRTSIRLVSELTGKIGDPPPPPPPGEGDGDEEESDGEGDPGGGAATSFTPGESGEWKPYSLPPLDLKNIHTERPRFDFGKIEKGDRGVRTAESEDAVVKTSHAKAMVEALESITESADGVRPVPSHLLEEVDGVSVKHGHKNESAPVSLGEWCPMRIKEDARPNRVPARIRGRARGVNDTGAIPVAIHRITSDSRVFRASRIKPMAGAVLIDNSGSMGFNESDLLRIMAALPAATIADYCSQGSRGELRILARKGRMVQKESLADSIGCGNGCDGLALRWLIQQPGPRFWVCDGIVTGVGDVPFSGSGEECLVLCRAGKVAQFHSIEQLEKMLADGTLSLRRHPPLRDADRPPYRIQGVRG